MPAGDVPMTCKVWDCQMRHHTHGVLPFLKILLKIISEVKPGSQSAARESQEAVTLQQLKVGVTGL